MREILHVVVDERDNMVFNRDAVGNLFTRESARAFASQRNGGLYDPSYVTGVIALGTL